MSERCHRQSVQASGGTSSSAADDMFDKLSVFRFLFTAMTIRRLVYTCFRCGKNKTPPKFTI